MFETMHNAHGIGLAATQVGELHRVIVIDISGVEEDEEGDVPEERPEHRTSPGLPTMLSLLNPEVVSEEGEWNMEEGCLSIPDVRADVRRAKSIRVRYRDINFEQQELIVDGLLARVILHEIDHLDGILFIDHISKTERGLLAAKLRRIKKGTTDALYPVKAYRKEDDDS
jgi:peptide deformylase